MKTMIIIPALNESATIAEVIQKIKKNGLHDILVVDDCSFDGTGTIALENGAELISLPINMGAWSAIQTGIRYALSKGYSAVLTMDGDNQHEPEYIKRLLKKLEQDEPESINRPLKELEQHEHGKVNDNIPGSFSESEIDGNRENSNRVLSDSDGSVQSNDVVIGSCLNRGSISKHFVWYFLKKLSGLDIMDITSGFRVYNRKAMKLLLTNESLILDYQDIGVLLLCKKNNLKIVEIDVKMNPRKNGKSRIYKNAAMIVKYLLSTLFLIGTKRW